jgi:hypothetical protein
MGDKSAIMNRDEVFLAMIMTRSLEDCVEKGREYLHGVMASRYLKSSSPTFMLLSNICSEQEEFHREIGEARKAIEAVKAASPGMYDFWLYGLLRRRVVKKELAKVERRLSIVTNST